MRRIFPILLVLSSLLLVGAEPTDKHQPAPGLRSALEFTEEEAEAAISMPPPSNKVVEKRLEEITKKLRQPLPDEREAFLAAGAANGWGQFDERGRVKSIFCIEATDADIRHGMAMD